MSLMHGHLDGSAEMHEQLLILGGLTRACRARLYESSRKKAERNKKKRKERKKIESYPKPDRKRVRALC